MEVEALITQLGSADVAQRRGAAEALSRERSARAVVPLVLACGDPDEQVQEAAVGALEDFGSPPREVASQLAAHLVQAGAVGYWAATLLGRLQADAAPWALALGQAVQQQPDMSVRQRAAWALGQIGPAAAAAIPALEAAAANADPRLARLSTSALKKIMRAS